MKCFAGGWGQEEEVRRWGGGWGRPRRPRPHLRTPLRCWSPLRRTRLYWPRLCWPRLHQLRSPLCQGILATVGYTSSGKWRNFGCWKSLFQIVFWWCNFKVKQLTKDEFKEDRKLSTTRGQIDLRIPDIFFVFIKRLVKKFGRVVTKENRLFPSPSRSPSPRWPRSRCPPTPSSPSRRTSSWRLCATTPPAGPSPAPKLIVELSHIFGLHKNESLFYKTPPSPFH